MDLFYFDPSYAILACLPCRYAIVPGTIASHLKAHHKDEVTREQIQHCVKYYAAEPIQSASVVQKLVVPRQMTPITYLTLYTDGIACRLCPDVQPYICRSDKSMRDHLREIHQWESGSKGGRPKKSSTEAVRTLWDKVTMAPVWCQTFHRSNFFRYFQVTPPVSASRPSSLLTTPRPMTVREQIEQQLAQNLEASERAREHAGLQSPHATEVSPWLEVTKWGDYLAGKSLQAAKHLIDLPEQRRVEVLADTDSSTGLSYNEVEEAQLTLILGSFDRLIEQARQSLAEEKINIFDQHKINSFLRRRTCQRPLLSKLKSGTYKTYQSVLKRLLCFVYRMIHLGEQPALHCTVTNAQSSALDQMTHIAQLLARVQARENGERQPSKYRDFNIGNDEERESTVEEENILSCDALRTTLDQACLQFYITLLDHHLVGRIYDSAVLGFVAVLGINDARDGFHDANTFTSKLSAFIKMAQLLVLQRAVVAAECRETEFPSEALDDMQDRFMVFESRSPMSFLLKLRSYGKKIRESTTCLGSLIWSDDGEKLSYMNLELSMSQLRYFIRFQLDRAHALLEEILLVHPTEIREEIVPPISLKDLKDNPAISAPGWNFLRDPRNTALHGYERWLLHRVLDEDRLQADFLKRGKWRRAAIKQYKSRVEAFLELLLLLVHITSGQPARGTELLSVQHCNTVYGLRRSIFIENGLVTFVTFYHKGYSVSGSVNLIHRYLPPEISELVVYYLWLVLPFCQQLDMLSSDVTHQPSAFLWSLQMQSGPWPSSRLSHVLQREFETHLRTKANINVWRHAAIAISRKHLDQRKFRKDYGTASTATWIDAQSAHGSLRAGLAYARALEEAPGHVEAARTEYRALCQDWHSLLGFGIYLGRRDCRMMVSPLTGASILQPLNVQKRSYLTMQEDANKETHLSPTSLSDIEAEVQRRVQLELLRMKYRDALTIHRRLPGVLAACFFV